MKVLKRLTSFGKINPRKHGAIFILRSLSLEDWLVVLPDPVFSRANDEMSRDSRLQYHGLTLVIRLQLNLVHNEGTLGLKFIKDKTM